MQVFDSHCWMSPERRTHKVLRLKEFQMIWMNKAHLLAAPIKSHFGQQPGAPEACDDSSKGFHLMIHWRKVIAARIGPPTINTTINTIPPIPPATSRSSSENNPHSFLALWRSLSCSKDKSFFPMKSILSSRK